LEFSYKPYDAIHKMVFFYLFSPADPAALREGAGGMLDSFVETKR